MHGFRFQDMLGILVVAFGAFVLGLLALRVGSAKPIAAVATRPAQVRRQFLSTGEAESVDTKLGGAALPTPPTRLCWFFEEGSTFFVEEVETVQGIPYAGMSLDRATQTVTRFRVLKRTEDGMVLEMRRQGYKITGTDPLVELENRLGEQMAKDQRNFVLAVTLTHAGQVERVEGLADWLARSTLIRKEHAEEILQIMEADERFLETFRRTFSFLPDHGVVKGESWQRPARLTFSCYGVLEGETAYTYEGPDEVGQVISYTSKWTDQYPLSTPFGVMYRAKLTAEPLRGRAVFDAVSGRLIRLDQSYCVQGTYRAFVVASGKEEAITVECGSTSTMRVLDRNPLN